MPPKAKFSQKRVQTLTDEEQLEVECKKFCEYLEKEKNKKTQIKDVQIVKSIEDILISYKEQTMAISDGIISDLVAVLEGGGKEFCARMVGRMFCMVLDMMLQADPLLTQAQRAVFLLSASLEPAYIHENKIRERRCTAIGTRCLKSLLFYFTNTDNDGLMRRWIGSLCSLLVRGSEKNLQILENCEESLRRGIGELIFKEVDDSIKIIAGWLIKAAADAGANHLDLWPADIDNKLYADFPVLAESVDWAKEFHRWLISLENKFIPPKAVGKIAFVNGIQFRLDGSSGDLVYENVLIFVHEEILSFLLLSPDGNMDHILDVAPLASMKSIAGVGDQSSQARELEIRFGLGSDGSIVAFWNGHQSEIGEILVRMDLDSAEAISPELLEACPSAKIIRLDGSEVPRELRQRGLSGDAIYLGSPDLPRRLDPGDESPNGEHSQQVTNTGEILSNALSVTKAGAFKKTQLDSASESHYVENEDLYDANPPKPKLRGVKASRQHEQEGQDDSSTKSRALSDGSSSTILRVGVRRINTAKEQNAKVDPAKKQRARNAVRPKAKKPLVQSQRRVDDSQNQSQKQIVITSTGNMTKKQIPHTPVVAPTENLAPPSSNVPKAARYVREDTNHQKLQSGQTATGKEATSKSQPKTVPIGSKPSTAQVPPSSMIEPSTAADLRNASAADTYDDDSIPSPDFGDASTPKVHPSISERCQKTGGHVTKEISQSQKNGLSLPVPTQRGSQSQKKRYSLNPPLKADTTRPAEASQFEIPLNEDDHLGKKTTSKTSKTPKTKTKAVSATGKVTKQKTTKESAVATVKKRQSAPAALDGGIAPSRSSQRAAATKAKDKIRDIDDGGDNFDMDIDEELPSLSNAKTRVDGKMSISKNKAESKVESQSEVVKDERSWSQHEAVENGNKSKGADKTGSKTEAVRLVSEPRSTVDDEAKMAKKQTSYESSKVNEDTKDYVPTQIEDEVVQRLQQEDAIELGLIQQSSPPFNPEDLHANSTPQLPVKQELPRNTIGTDKSKQGSSLTKLDHFANMLGGMLDEVSDVGDEVLSRGQQVQEPKHLSQAAAVSETRQKNSQSHEQDPIVISSPPPSETPSSIEFFGPNEDAELSNDMASAPSAEGFVTRKTTSPQNKEEIDHHTTAVSTLRTKELTAIEYTLPQHKDKSKYTASAPSMEKHTTRKSPLPQAIAQPSSSELLYSSQKDASSSFTKMRGDSSISRTEVTVIKPVFTKLDIFKKPDLPATIATQLNDPEGRLVESATTISESEVAQEIITIPSMNTDNNIEQEEGMDETRIKRKAPTLENLVSKKPRSTRTGEEVASNNIAHGPLSRNAPELKPASPSPITGSPDLPPHIHTTAQKSSEGASMEPSTEKDPSRKPNIIAFDRRGPLNQGQLNMSKSSTRREIRTIDKEVLPERKRKRNQEAIAGNPSPPKKRQNSSPVHNDDNYDYEENALTYNQIPVAAPADRHVSIGSRSTRSRSCLQSYLPSRVALNGSPVGAGEVNHFGRLEERLSQASNQHEPNDQQTDPDQPSITTQELPALFGPKIQLGAKPKLRGSSPEEVTTRYIAHERTRNGQYKEIGSEGVITPGNVVDPFVDRTRKSSSSSDFTDKLLESSKLKDHSNIAPQPSGQPRNVQNDKSQAKQIPREGYRAGYHPATTNYRKSTRSQYAVQDSVKTLAESDVRHPRPTSPESNLSGSSQESHSSDNSEKDDPRVLRDVWNMAIRPHYSDAHRAIHTIADEVITRLSDEEERVHLIIKQYDQNSTKILDKLTTKREEEKKAILRKLDLKSKQMVILYTDANEYIQEKMDELKEDPISAFQKEWHKKQDEIQKLISVGMAELK